MATRKKSAPEKSDNDAIDSYASELSTEHAAVCNSLRASIDAAMPKASSKIWHGSPVWFIGENPVVGYAAKAGVIALLFWNGQSFKEPGLTTVGKFHAAEARFNKISDIDQKALQRWLKKARTDIFDSVAMIKRNRAKAAKKK